MGTNMLLDENSESYYWMGFLLADGYCHPNKTHICLTVSQLDETHLHSLKTYLKVDRNLLKVQHTCNGEKFDCVRLNLYDSSSVKKLLSKFNWKSKKTYNPPETSVFNDIGEFKTICWLIGFIDGDGCVQNQHKRNDAKISIHIHSNWMKIIEYLHNLISDFFKFNLDAKPRILKTGYLRYDITNTRLVQSLKKFAIANNLPILARKWDKIDLERIHIHDKANILQQKIMQLKSEGFTRKEISELVNISINTVDYYLYQKKRQTNLETQMDPC